MILGLKLNSLAGGQFDHPCTKSDPYTLCNKGLSSSQAFSCLSYITIEKCCKNVLFFHDIRVKIIE